MHIHRIGSFPFPGSHLRGGLGPAQHTRSSNCRPVDRGVNIVIDELVLEICLSGRLNGWWRWCGRTDNNFIVIICITELMHDFNNDADEIALARRQSLQQIKAACDKSRRKGFLRYHMSCQHSSAKEHGTQTEIPHVRTSTNEFTRGRAHSWLTITNSESIANNLFTLGDR